MIYCTQLNFWLINIYINLPNKISHTKRNFTMEIYVKQERRTISEDIFHDEIRLDKICTLTDRQ